MITGSVRASREAVIPLSVLDSAGQPHYIEAVLDTGFTGSLTLPPSTIAALGLTWRSRGRAILADGSTQTFDIYAATVVWDGAPRSILVEEVDTAPLLGMLLVWGYDIHIAATDGGTVTIGLI
jgi:clan AA aspartic protease